MSTNMTIHLRYWRQSGPTAKGYFEDRRPSSELDPYIVTALLFATSCNIKQDYYN